MLRLLINKKGVTLLELLTVIIILGVIAAIAVPTVGGLIANQKEKAAKAEWVSIHEASRLYIQEGNADIDENGVFSLEELISSGYLEGYDSTIILHVVSGRRVTKIKEYTLITFDSETGELSIYAAAVEINGILVEGAYPPIIPDNRI